MAFAPLKPTRRLQPVLQAHIGQSKRAQAGWFRFVVTSPGLPNALISPTRLDRQPV